jgi:Glycosyl hydrolases family 2, TIM barrel domain
MSRALPALVTSLALLVVHSTARGQDDAAPISVPPPAADSASPRVSLDGRWDLVLDRENNGVTRGLQLGRGPGWERALKVAVPGPLESNPQATDYDGVAWYRCVLPAATAPEGGRLLLLLDEIDWRADAWLDGESLGRHDGPGAFRVDLTGRLDDSGHLLVLRVVDPGEKLVDELLLSALPSGRQGWYYNVGGLLGSASLLPTAPVMVLRHDARLLPDGGAQLRVDVLNLEAAPRDVVLRADLGGVAGELPATLAPGESSFTLPLPGAEQLPHWSPESPALHALALEVRGADGTTLARATGRAGLRRFVAEGERFVIDGQPIRLHGVGYPASYPRGLSRPPDDGFLRRDLQAIKEAGFNLVRVEQSSAPEVWELCDEIGLLVHAEPPLGRIGHELPVTAPAVDSALVAFAQAVQGHPSVVMVSVLDEGGGLLWRRQDELFRRAQALLPERLLLSDSGGTTGTTQLLNPHEPAALPVDDVRLAIRWPWDEGQQSLVNNLGSTGRLAYVSRWSAGGLPSFVDNVGGFASALTSRDAALHVQRLQDATTQLASTPLGQVVRDLSQLTALGQSAQARAVRSIGSALRTQGHVAGEVYASWRDVAWQDAEGLCDAWSRAKPALSALRSCGSLPPTLGELPARTNRPIATGSLAGLTPGVQAIVAGLVARPGEATGVPRIAVAGERQIAWTPESQGITVALLRFVRDGGTLLLLAPPDAGHPLSGDLSGDEGAGQVADLPIDLSARPLHRPDAHGTLLFAEKSALLADLPLELPVLDDRLAAVAPLDVLYAPPGIGLDVELACVDEAGRYVGAAVQAVGYGKGHLVLSTLRLTDETVADPAAARLLENLVRYTAGLAARKPEPPPTTADAPAGATRDAIQQHVWRYKIWFGLAERMATARIPGLPPAPRSDAADLPTMVTRKNTGLDLIIQGKATEGDAILALVDGGPLLGDRERFLRNELSLADALRARQSSESPLLPAERLELQGLHARALRLLRMGEAQAGVGMLDQALEAARKAGAAAPPTSAAAGAGG